MTSYSLTAWMKYHKGFWNKFNSQLKRKIALFVAIKAQFKNNDKGRGEKKSSHS